MSTPSQPNPAALSLAAQRWKGKSREEKQAVGQRLLKARRLKAKTSRAYRRKQRAAALAASRAAARKRRAGRTIAKKPAKVAS